MNKKNLVVLLISIIFPILVTVFIGLYSYGSFGNWQKNQTKFIESIFNEETETTTSIENYVKFSSSYYLNLSENMTVYSDYLEKTELESVNGTYTLDNKFSIAPYVFAEQYEEDGLEKSFISHFFFMYNLNYNNIAPTSVYFICVQGNTDEDYNHLLDAIEQFNTIWEDESTTGSAIVTSSRGGDYPIYDIHAVLEDDADEDEETTPYAYSFQLTGNYQVEDEDGEEEFKEFNTLANCSFALIEIKENNTTNVLLSGVINNIKRNASALANVSNVEKGFGSTAVDELKVLQNAGYTSFVLPTLAWQCAIAFVVSGVIALLFYMTWIFDEQEANKHFKKKRK